MRPHNIPSYSREIHMNILTPPEFWNYIASSEATLTGLVYNNIDDSVKQYNFLRECLSAQGHRVEAIFLSVRDTSSTDNRPIFSMRDTWCFAALVVDKKDLYYESAELLSFLGKKGCDQHTVIDDMLQSVANEMRSSPSETSSASAHIQRKAEQAALLEYVFDDKQDVIIDAISRILIFSDNDIVDYLAQPSAWGKKGVESLLASPSFGEKKFNDTMAIDHLKANLVLKYSTDTSEFPHVFRSLLDAVKGYQNVELVLQVNGNSLEVSFPTMKFQYSDILRTKCLWPYDVPTSKERRTLSTFIKTSVPDAGKYLIKDTNDYLIPLQYVAGIRCEQGFLWKNPEYSL